MSLAHELDLESQTELLERLQLLTRFGSNLVNVCGRQGQEIVARATILDSWRKIKTNLCSCATLTKVMSSVA